MKKKEIEKTAITFWPVLAPLRIIIYFWFLIGGLLWKLSVRFEDWVIKKTV